MPEAVASRGLAEGGLKQGVKVGEVLDAAFQGEVDNRPRAEPEFAGGVLHADAVHVGAGRAAQARPHDARNMLGTAPGGAHETGRPLGKAGDFPDLLAGNGEPIGHGGEVRTGIRLEHGIETEQESLQGQAMAGGASESRDLMAQGFYLHGRQTEAYGKGGPPVMEAGQIGSMSCQQIRQHPGGEGEINEHESIAVHGDEDVPVGRPDEDEVAGIEPFVAAIDPVARAAAFDPEDFRKIVGVEQRPAIGEKAEPGEMIPLAGRDEVAPALFFHDINIA